MYVIVSYILCVTCDHNPSLGTMQTLKCTVVLYMHNLYSYCTCETSIRSFHSPVLRLFAIKNFTKTIRRPDDRSGGQKKFKGRSFRGGEDIWGSDLYHRFAEENSNRGESSPQAGSQQTEATKLTPSWAKLY